MPKKKTTDQTSTRYDMVVVIFGILILLTSLISSGTTIFSGVFDQNSWLMAVIFLFATVLLARHFFTSPKSAIALNWLDIVVLAWLLWLIVTTIFSYNPTESFWGVVSRTGGLLHWASLTILYFIVRSLSPFAEEFWRKVKIAIMTVGSLVAIVGLLKLLLETQEGSELLGILGNQNFTAYFLAVAIITTYILWIDGKKMIGLPFWALILQSAALWLTYARWTYAVLFIAIIIVHLFLTNKGLVTQIKNRILIGVMALIALLMIGSYLAKGTTYFNFNYDSLTHRIAAWELSFEASKDYPILGWGLENYDNAFQTHFEPEFESPNKITETFDRPHNFLLLHLVTTGWIGLLLFLSILASAIYWGISKMKSSNEIWALGVIVTYIGLNLFGFEMMATTSILILALGYIGSLAKPVLKFGFSSYWSLAGAAILPAWLICFVVMPWVGSQTAWAAAKNMDLNGFHSSLKNTPHLRAELGYYLVIPRYITIKDANSEFYERLAIYLNTNANHRDGQPAYHLAIANAWEKSKSPDRLINMKSNIQKAMEASNQNNGYYWAFLAGVELEMGNVDAAQTAINKALELNPDSSYTVGINEIIKNRLLVEVKK